MGEDEASTATAMGESRELSGGGGGIRTRDTVSRIHTFQACAFDRSATPPVRADDAKEARITPPASPEQVARA